MVEIDLVIDIDFSKISKRTGKPKARRGFASMDPEKRKAIAAKGGGSVPAEKRSFARSKELAVSAGRKGGLMTKEFFAKNRDQKD